MTDSPQSEPDQPPTPTPTRADVLDAVSEVRREGFKAGVLHGFVDALLVFLGTVLALTVLGITDVGPAFALSTPAIVAERFAEYGLVLPPTLEFTTPIVVGAAAAVAVLLIETVYFYRRATVERFESLNPAVREALRTARDAAGDAQDSAVARALYRDVIQALGNTSSRKFLGIRRLSVSIVLVAILAVAVIGVSFAGIQFGPGADPSGGPGGIGEGPGNGEPIPEPGEGAGVGVGGVLGDRAEVDRGLVDEAIRLEGDENGAGEARPTGAYDSSGFSVDPADIEASPAEYTDEDQIEDAEVIREYNERIREQTGD